MAMLDIGGHLMHTQTILTRPSTSLSHSLSFTCSRTQKIGTHVALKLNDSLPQTWLASQFPNMQLFLSSAQTFYFSSYKILVKLLCSLLFYMQLLVKLQISLCNSGINFLIFYADKINESLKQTYSEEVSSGTLIDLSLLPNLLHSVLHYRFLCSVHCGIHFLVYFSYSIHCLHNAYALIIYQSSICQ